MSKVITFSTRFPTHHINAGKDTEFIRKIRIGLALSPTPILITDEHNSMLSLLPKPILITDENNSSLFPKFHTIRSGYSRKVGEIFSPRVWSGIPRRSKQIAFAPDLKIRKIWEFQIDIIGNCFINNKIISTETIERLANNDGLGLYDFASWFQLPGWQNELNRSPEFSGQIICWNRYIEY